MTKITMDGKYQTRDGRPATVLTTSAKHRTFPVVALIHLGDRDLVETFTPDGSWDGGCLQSESDLIPIPEKRTVEFWVNVYEDYHTWFEEKCEADHLAKPGRLACLHIIREYTVGEGL